MKKDIINAVLFVAFAIVGCTVLVGTLILFLAVPDILSWLSGYIGEFMTWVLFIISIALFVSYCIKSK